MPRKTPETTEKNPASNNSKRGNMGDLYIKRLIEKIKEGFAEWIRQNNYKSAEDIRQDKQFGNEPVYEVVRWKKLASKCDNVNLAYLQNINPGLQLENRVESIKYLENKGKIRIDVPKFCENRIFSEQNNEKNQ